MLKFAILGTITTLLAASHASAAPMICKVALSSPDGGHIEVTKTDARPKFPYISASVGVIWHPPTSNASIDLKVWYGGVTFEKLALYAVHADFSLSEGAGYKQYQGVVSSEGAQIWRANAGNDMLGINQAVVPLLDNLNHDKAVLALIGSGKPIKVVILKRDKGVDTEVFNGTRMNLAVLEAPKEVMSATFDMSGTVGRDQLIAQARDLIETGEPTVCKPIDLDSEVPVPLAK